ncbi:M48 family metalloprotease [Sphingomonas sp. RG327]|jgi:predicted Zn-dependent protease|uniref:M48 family metalloprotease n=1 Tax=Sphingomonas anseongensis TaxID=2908207 RepID=A0ABT0RD34_9SPHN|nr:M48 family metallopeptidase [Sphingomonas anseongensis]MCL6678163.1 M48 family metalloprotease [Sphingomonas anseongensis]
MCIRCEISRRSLLAAGGALAAATMTGVAQARIKPADMVPLIGPGFKPADRDEQGLWQQMDRVEEEVAGSNLVMKNAGIDSYVRDLIGKVGGPAARDMRIYVVRIPEFNAMMFPSGFAVVFSGLLLRMRSEAQLAGVIAHEGGHFLRRHMIRQWRDMRRKTDIFTIGAMLAGVGGAGAGVYLGDFVQLAQLGTLLSLFRYSRELEAEADAMGVRLIAEAGYAPIEMSNTWAQLIGELDASARYRRKHRDRGYDLFATHPAEETRMADLRASAAEMTVPGRTYDAGRPRYLEAIAPIRQMLLDDQVKLNDPGASQYVIETLAQDGWNGLLRFYEGEVWRLRNRRGDQERAEQSYAIAVAYPDAPPDAWRWHGLSLIKQGRTAEARSALSRYLSMKPDAVDAAYIRQMIS